MTDKEDLPEEEDAKPAVSYPILNFFGGTVTTDRQRHENKAQDGGLKYWRNNTSKQREEDNPKAFTNKSGHTDYDLVVPKTGMATSKREHSTGMGLEGENFHSFLTTGSHQTMSEDAAATAVSQANKSQAEQTNTAIEKSDLKVPSSNANPTVNKGSLGTGAIYNYRSKASSTFTNLPPLKHAQK